MPIDQSSLAHWMPGAEVMTAFPPPGLYLDGSGDYAQAPDATGLHVSGDFDLRVAVNMFNQTAGVPILGRWASGQQHFYLGTVVTSGKLILVWSTNGSTAPSASSTVAPGFVAGTPLLVRVVLQINVSGQYNVKFYTRRFYFSAYVADLDDDTISATAWVQLGSTIVGSTGPTSVFGSSTAPLQVGGITYLPAYLQGAVYAAELKNGVGGTDVRFNPDFGGQLDTAASFSDTVATPNTFTLNGNAYLVPAMMVDGWLLEDGAPFDPSIFPDLDQALANGGIYGTDGGTGFPLLPDMMNANRFPRGGWVVGATGGVDAHTYAGSNNVQFGGSGNRMSSIDGVAGNTGGTTTFDNKPPWMNRAFWIKT